MPSSVVMVTGTPGAGNSLNTGAAFVEQRLGNERFTQYFKNFGLGEATGIDLPGELSGHIDNLETSRDIEHITAAYGQGIAITPIEMVRALSVLANGGVLVTPHVVSSIQYTNGIVKELSYPPGRRVIRPETSETITRMLVSVVDNYLLGGTVKKPNYAIAAKTGTAQVADPATGKYSEDRFLHSFFGYLPAYQPRFIVFFFALEPHGVPFASGTFTNPFMKTADFLINYYEIAPDRHPVS
jgi:cell division protein FtsI/penicillin-binding protein 2